MRLLYYISGSCIVLFRFMLSFFVLVFSKQMLYGSVRMVSTRKEEIQSVDG